MIQRYHTKSGSIYELDVTACLVRKVQGGAATRRVTEEWRPFQSARMINTQLLIIWGIGRDEVSDDLGTPEECEPMRTTLTSPIVRVGELLPSE